MASLRSSRVDRREAAVAAALSGAAFIVVGYGTGLGVSTVADPSASFTRPPIPAAIPSIVAPPSALPTIAAPVAAQSMPTTAPVLTAPLAAAPPPVIVVIDPQPAAAPACQPSAPSTARTGLLADLDLSTLASPVTKILGTVPIVGSLLAPPSTAPCPTAASCCPTSEAASAR